MLEELGRALVKLSSGSDWAVEAPSDRSSYSGGRHERLAVAGLLRRGRVNLSETTSCDVIELSFSEATS
jgi:hypothetical protein